MSAIGNGDVVRERQLLGGSRWSAFGHRVQLPPRHTQHVKPVPALAISAEEKAGHPQ